MVREDAQILYGFGATEASVRVSGTHQDQRRGAAYGAVRLVGLSVAELSPAVTRRRPGRLIKVPGIGKKPPNACCWSSRQTRSRPGAPAHAVGDSHPTSSKPCWPLGYSDKEAAAAA